ncbi:OmpA family protein [Flavivirga sp. 57AJ16]|uniref:OmpA family protein n=1 Tax=Flavivirga sp. 57AJ16 TaxID=3025307 RepID=UPI0023653E1C|nr:OmpA family protein [Flavivirga sp. 57AJ16]MDD7886229.1 OmpA family protein [Flavivirga sp. 57AJ16]
MKKGLLFFFSLFFCCYTFSQNHASMDFNGASKEVLLKLGVNAVDNSGESNIFNSLSSFKNSAFHSPFKIGAEYRFSKFLSLGLDGSVNTWKVPNAKIDGNILEENQDYFSLDINTNFYLNEAFDWFLNEEWLELYISGGAGYFKITQGGFSGNIGAGTNIWMTPKFGFNLDGKAKLVLDSEPSIYETNHFQISIGIVFKLSNTKRRSRIIVDEKKGDGAIDGTSVLAQVNHPKGAMNKSTISNNQLEEVTLKKENSSKNIISNDSLIPDKDEYDKNSANYLLNLSRKIHFNTGNYNFTQQSYPVLKRILSIMLKYPEVKFKIEGHADSVGSYSNNQQLSKKRASAVRNYLISGGVNPNNIVSIGRGELMPIASNRTKLGQSRNRRVEILKDDKQL